MLIHKDLGKQFDMHSIGIVKIGNHIAAPSPNPDSTLESLPSSNISYKRDGVTKSNQPIIIFHLSVCRSIQCCKLD